MINMKTYLTKSIKFTIGCEIFASFLFLQSQVQAASAPGESPPPLALQPREFPERSLKLNYKINSIPLQIILDDATAIEKAGIGASHKGQPLKIGFGRAMPQPYQGNIQPMLWWETLPNGGKVATFTVSSPEASGVRLGLYLNEFPETAELRFFNPNQLTQTFGSFHVRTIRNRMPFWSPVVEGENIGAEIYVPATVTTEFAIRIANIQHLIYSPLQPDPKNLGQIGNADPCEIDVKCRTTNPNNLSAAVAKIIFTRTDGSFICTGTLLSDNDNTTRVPYFMTAHHCISTQDAADTVNSYWFFEKAACNGANPTSVIQFNSGGELLATGEATDFTLLKLRDNEISNLNGIHFAGWSSAANPIGLNVIGIHHPKGDLKKLSTGHADNYASWSLSGATDHIQVTWSEGVTEAGSSGSGIFAVTGEQNNQHLFIGSLHGGWSYCNTPNEPDLYGRFNLTYPLVRQWLNATDTPTIQAYLESPRQGSYESGIGLIRGWACEANTVEIQINNTPKQNVPYGSNRGDTVSVCGDNNNGFGFTYNWNSLGNGTHTLKLFIDGIEFTTVTFTVTTLGVEFLQGASKESTVTNFPQPGVSVKLRWSEPHQNFVIVPIDP